MRGNNVFQIKMVILVSVLFNLTIFVSPNAFSYTRISNCIEQSQNGCLYWQSTLEFSKELDPLCFPQDTYLQGRQGKIKMSDLKVNDQVLVYSQDGLVFQKIKAWLHRDVQEWYSYNYVGYQIMQNQQFQNKSVIQSGFYISGMHNIAVFSNQTDQILYKFAQTLNKGDILFGHGPYLNSQTPRTSQISKMQKMKGVYAPYTTSGNYFITSSMENNQLILVHCFAHVSTSYHFAFDFMIGMTPFWNVQPQQNSYIHPLSNILKDVFPSVVQIKSLNHMASQMQHNSISNKQGKHPDYRYQINNSQRDFSLQRNSMIVIDKVLSIVEQFV